MNRLIIIGNGFDLANDLKTSYEHFLIDHFKKLAIKSLYEIDPVQDGFSTGCYSLSGVSQERVEFMFDQIESVQELLSHKQIKFFRLGSTWNQGRDAHSSEIVFRLQSNFFNGLLENKNWTDIEKFYFNTLLKTKTENSFEPSKYQSLNSAFNLLKDELKDYISIIDDDFLKWSKGIDLLKFPRGSFFYNLFAEEPFQNTKIVNFNYTNTARKFVDDLKDRSSELKIEIIDIHGTRKSKEIVFGYGDESHASYQELEDADDNELLKNMKSFYYGFSNDYSELMAFVDKEDFTVEVIGHSLGLSDRLLFREIFERDNCKKIKLYHRGTTESYFNKRIALSRHFKDNTQMRNKVLEYDAKDMF